MRARTFAGALRRRAEGEGRDAPALRLTEAGREGATTWSVGALWDIAARVAAALRRRGVSPGERVLVLSPEIESAVAAHFGAWAHGVTPVHVGLPYRVEDPAAFIDELGRLAERIGARRLLLSGALAGFASPDDPRLVSIEALRADRVGGASLDPDTLPPPDLVQLTSGSTGRPRVVVVPHERMRRHLEAITEALPAGEGAAGVTWLPLCHDMGLLGGLLYPLHAGFPVHLLSPLVFQARPFAWLEALSAARATHTAAPPSAYALALRLAPRAASVGLRLDRLRCAMVGAEPIAPSLLRAFAAAFAATGFREEAFFPVYGLAEATVAVTFPRLLAAPRVLRVDRARLEREGEAQEVADEGIEITGVGRPLPGTELRIAGPDGEALAEGRVGEILVRSASLMDRYDGEPDATQAALRDGWLRTGDLGLVRGGDLFVTGRAKDLIIKGGHNLMPEPIELATSTVEGVRAGCVVAVGVRDERRQTEEVVVVAETRLPAEAWADLDRRVRAALRLAGIAVDRVVFVPPGWLPRTTSGKHRRREVATRLTDEASPRATPRGAAPGS